jgi:superfamily II DNA or RNA helicase
MMPIITNRVNIPIASLTRAQFETLKVQHIFANPDWAENERLKFSNWNTPKTIETWDVRTVDGEPCLSLPRGCQGQFKETTPGGARIGTSIFDSSEPISLRPEQAKVIDDIIENKIAQGMIVAPCAAGKTVMALALAQRLEQRTLIVCHTVRLLNQWVSRIKSFLGPKKIGIFGQGKREISEITVGLVQSLTGHMQEVGLNFGLVILDEAHHVAATTFMNVIDMTHARYRFGFTATPNRADHKEFLAEEVFGPIIATITLTELVDADRVLPVEPVLVETEFEFEIPENDPRWHKKLIDAIIADGPRNELIVDKIVSEIRAGQFCLALTDRLIHCDILALRLKHEGYNALIFKGMAKEKEIDRMMEQIESGAVQCVIGTSVADEGLDIPRISRVFICLPGANNAGRLTQRAGRARRIFAGKTDAKCIYFLDSRVGCLRWSGKKVIKILKQN